MDRYDLIDRSESCQEDHCQSEDLSTEHFDPEHIQCLSAHVLCTHVDNAFQTKTCADSGRRNAMLSSSCFSNNTRFPDPASEQNLADSIIDLV